MQEGRTAATASASARMVLPTSHPHSTRLLEPLPPSPPQHVTGGATRARRAPVGSRLVCARNPRHHQESERASEEEEEGGGERGGVGGTGTEKGEQSNAAGNQAVTIDGNRGVPRAGMRGYRWAGKRDGAVIKTFWLGADYLASSNFYRSTIGP